MGNNLNDLESQGYTADILESIKKHIIIGNVFRIIGVVLFSIIGIALLALQGWNNFTTSTILSDVNYLYNAVYDPCTSSSTTTTPGSSTQFFDPSMSVDKPIIYLYPEEKKDVHVSLELKKSEMLYMWPNANQAENNIYNWDVTADKNGKIQDENGNEYSYLFWATSALYTHISINPDVKFFTKPLFISFLIVFSLLSKSSAISTFLRSSLFHHLSIANLSV